MTIIERLRTLYRSNWRGYHGDHIPLRCRFGLHDWSPNLMQRYWCRICRNLHEARRRQDQEAMTTQADTSPAATQTPSPPDTLAHFVHMCQQGIDPPKPQCGHVFGDGGWAAVGDEHTRCAVCLTMIQPEAHCAHCGDPLWKTTNPHGGTP